MVDFAGIFDLEDMDFARAIFGSKGKVPPESVARKVLCIGTTLPLDKAAIRAVFRFRIRLLRPDLTDDSADALRAKHLEHLAGDKAEQLAELLWARDDLLSRVKEPVTGANVTPSHPITRNVCKACQNERLTSGGKPYRVHRRRHRWAGYCYPCAHDAENERNRERRRRARSNRSCKSCGKRFTPSRADGIYCSTACRQRAYRQRSTA